MTAPIFGEPTSQAQVVFQQTLNVFFQCGHCSKLLVDQVPFAMLADGKLTDLMCPRCNRVWSFCRHPVVTERDPALEHAIEDADRHAQEADVSSTADPSVACTRCGATLTAPESIARRLGPVCAAKLDTAYHAHMIKHPLMLL